MKQQPDKFFESHLKNYGKTPPPLVWDRLEENLNRKAPRILYVKIAASLLILLAAGSLLWTYTPDDQRIASIHNASEPTNTSKRIRQNHDSSNTSPIVAKPVETPVVHELGMVAPDRDIKIKRHVRKAQASTFNQPVANVAPQSEPMDTELVVADSIPGPFANPQPAFKPKKEESITITLSHEETKQYLAQPNPADATSDLEKTSTFQRLLKKAADLSTNQDPFGQLRQRKNEILALNFGADKQRGQKK